MIKNLYVWLFHTKIVRAYSLKQTLDIADIYVKSGKWLSKGTVKVSFFNRGFRLSLVRKGYK